MTHIARPPPAVIARLTLRDETVLPGRTSHPGTCPRQYTLTLLYIDGHGTQTSAPNQTDYARIQAVEGGGLWVPGHPLWPKTANKIIRMTNYINYVIKTNIYFPLSGVQKRI